MPNDENERTNIADETTNFKGIWFEKQRTRWRVRLYYKGHIFHLSYHTDYRDAIETLVTIREQLTHTAETMRKREAARRSIVLHCTTIHEKPTTGALLTTMRHQLATEKPTLDSRRQCPKHCATHKSRKN